jgi:uncharacterized protein (TIRG00374 family)
MQRALKATLGLAISIACMWLAFRSVSLSQLWAVLPSIPVETVVACLAVGSSTLFLRSIRWRILLQSSEPVSVRTAFAVNAAGQMGNAILPARVGDLFRATNLGRAGLSSGFALATVVVERVLDAGALVLISSLVLAGREGDAPWLAQASRLVAVAAVAGLAFTILLPRLEGPILRLSGVVAPVRWKERVHALAQEFLLGLRSFHHARRAAGFLLLTFVIWLVDSTGVIVLAHGFGLRLALSQAVLLISALGLSSALPAAPGNLGVVQYVVVTVLASFGVARPEALGLGVILQLINIVTLSSWGLAGLWFLSARPHVAQTLVCENQVL